MDKIVLNTEYFQNILFYLSKARYNILYFIRFALVFVKLK